MNDIRPNVLRVYFNNDRKKCKLCERREIIKLDDTGPASVTIEIPKHSRTLRIVYEFVDEELDECDRAEYLFEARYCPICGKMLTTPFYWEND